MATRVQLGAKVDPIVEAVIKRRAKALKASKGYMVEMMAAEMFKDELPGYRPGQRVEDD